jgi:hypothetical protein
LESDCKFGDIIDDLLSVSCIGNYKNNNVYFLTSRLQAKPAEPQRGWSAEALRTPSRACILIWSSSQIQIEAGDALMADHLEVHRACRTELGGSSQYPSVNAVGAHAPLEVSPTLLIAGIAMY